MMRSINKCQNTKLIANNTVEEEEEEAEEEEEEEEEKEIAELNVDDMSKAGALNLCTEMVGTTEKFEKRKGIINRYGVLFEEKMTSLIFLKLIKLGIPFYLCSNLEGVGEFDDIVVRYCHKLPNSVEEKYETLFIQLKYSQFNNAPRTVAFLKNNPYFDLEKYFVSFCLCNNIVQQEHRIFCGDPSERLYLAYTNADVKRDMLILEDRSSLNDVVSSIASPGDVLAINTETLDSKDEYKEFCDTVHKVKDIISNEVNNDVFSAECKKAIEEETDKFEGSNGYLKKVVKELKTKPVRNVKEILQKYEQVDIKLLSRFQQQSKICCLQMDINELDKCIERELAELLVLSPKESCFAFKKLTKYIKNWRDSEDFYLTENTEMWTDIVRSTQQMRFQNLPKMLSSSNIHFSRSSVNQLLPSFQEMFGILNIVSNGELTTFTTLKVWQTLQSIHLEDYIIVHTDECLNDSKVWEIWPNIWCRTLVVECTNDVSKCRRLVEKICEIIEKEEKARVILISPKSSNFYNLFKKKKDKAYKEIADSSGFVDLDENSKYLISEKTINFQGNTVKLNAVLSNREMEGLSCNMLSKLISKETVRIGKDIHEQKTENYIPRFLVLPYIHEDIFKMKEKGTTIAFETTDEVSEIYAEETVNLAAGSDNGKHQNNLLVKQMKTATSTQESFAMEIFNKKEHIQELSDKHENIHWIQIRGNDLIWKKSKGDVKKIAGYIIDGPEESEENFILSKKESPIVITADSGMGKSTLLHNMAQSLKNMYPSNWVILISLPKLCYYFWEMRDQKIDDSYVANFLKASQNVSDGDFQNFLQSPLRLDCFIILLDAFDEILPDYGEQVISLIRYLSERSYSVFVTSRQNTEPYLQRELSVIPYKLQPFNYNAQKNYISNLWKTGKPDIDEEIINNFADELLQTYLMSFENTSNTFTGNPLQIKMLAEIYEDKITEDCCGKLGKKLNIMEIYTKFIEKSCARYFHEKKDADLSKPDIQREFGKFMEEFIEGNKNVSALLIFGETSFNECMLEEIRNKVNKFFENNYRHESVGICKILNGAVIYNHRSFTEYFAALWLADNYLMNDAIVKMRLFKKGMAGVRSFFDFKVSEDCLLHTAILTGELKHTANTAYENDNIHDKMGRTAMHLSAAYNNKAAAAELLSIDSDLYSTYDDLHWGPINYAIAAHSWEMVNFLIDDSKFKVDEISIWHEMESLINEAVFVSCIDSLQQLLKFISRNSYLNKPFLTPQRLKELKLVEKQTNLIDMQEQIKVTTAAEFIPIHLATSFNKIDIINLLLEKNCNLDVKDKDGYTPLHIASRNGYLNIIEFLIERGHFVDCYSTDHIQVTPLHLSAQNGHLHAVKLLAENHAKINAKSKNGNTAIMMAASNGHLEIVKYLINQGADVNNINDDGNNAILLAFINGHLGIINILEKNGAEISCINKYGYDAFLLAAKYGHFEVVKYWIRNGRNSVQTRKYDGNNAAIIAFKNNHFDIVKYCIENGNEIDLKNKNGDSILLLAADRGNLEIVIMCVTKNANLNQVNRYGESPLLLASRKGYLEIVKLCVDSEADVNIINKYGDSALLIACRYGHTEIVKYCLAHGANVNNVREPKDSAVLLALENNHIDIALYCIDKEADVSLKNRDGDTALSLAAEKGYFDVVQSCIKHNANVDHANNAGNTALILAATYNNYKIAEYCIKNKANVNLVNKNNDTALLLASKNGNLELIICLMSHGADINYKEKLRKSSALLIASENGHKSVVEYLLENGADTEHQDKHGNNALLLALTNGHLDTAMLCINRGINIDTVNNYGYNALLVASERGYIDIVKQCIQHKADLNYVKKETMENAMFIAIENEHLNIVLNLLKNKADVRQVNKCGNTILLECVKKGYTNTVENCIKYGGDINHVNKNGDTALLLACTNGYYEIVKLCIEKGANINKVNANGDNVITLAAKRGNLNIIKYCIEKGANINHYRNNCKDNVVILALKHRHFDIAKYCLENGADINYKNADHDSAFLLAAKEGCLDIVNYCLQKSTDVSQLNKYHYNAGLYAAEYGHKDIVETCVKHHINMNCVRIHNSENMLQVALENDHLDIVEYCLDNGIHVNHKNSKGDTALLIASRKGILATVTHCIERGADINHVNENGDSAFILSCKSGYLQIAEYLASKEADLNIVNKLGYSALLTASLYDYMDIVRFCINNGADINYSREQDGVSVLQHAAESGNIEIVKLCLEKGANVNQVNNDRETALSLATSKGYVDIIKCLTENNANLNHVNNYGYSPLMIAAENGYINIVEHFIDNNCDIKSNNDNWDDALLLALKNDHFNVAGYLIKHGSNVRHLNKYGENAFLLSVKKENIDIVKLCLKYGANKNCTNNDGDSALLIATRKNSLSIVQCLLRKKANVNYINYYGYSALLLAAKFGYFNIFKLYVENSASINYVRENGCESALSLAFENKHFDIVKYCLDHGGDPNLLNKHKENILMLAAKNGFSDIVEQCIEEIKNIDNENVNGDTALTLAATYGHLDVVKMCISHGANINHSKHTDNNNAVLLALQNGHLHVVNYCLNINVDKT